MLNIFNNNSKLNAFKLFSAILLSSFIISCGPDETNDQNSDDRSADQGQEIPAVQAVEARQGALPLVQRLTGTVRAENQVTLTPEITARVEQVFVENGDQVSKGQALVKLDDVQIREQLKQAEANLQINKARLKQAQARYNQLNSNYKRQKQLAEKQLVSNMEMESLEAQMSSAEADIELAKAQVNQSRSSVEEQQNRLNQTTVRAPVAGTVGQRNAQAGMLVNPNTQLFTVGDLDKLRVEVVLTEKMLSYLEVGQTAKLYVENREGNEIVLEGELSRISPFLNNTTRSTEAEIDIANSNNLLKPGMFVPVDILYGESGRATLIPKSALYTNKTDGQTGVYLAKSIGVEVQPVQNVDPKNPPPLTEPLPVNFVPIEILAEGRMDVAVTGIKQGQWVVTIGQELLSDGRKTARIRTVNWDRIVSLQKMQRQDLLYEILNRADSSSSDPQATTL